MTLDDLIARQEVSLVLDPDDGVVRLKVGATFDEPIELTPETARELAARLLELAGEVD